MTARYVLDGSDEDLARLLRIAEISAPSVREALARVGVGPGWRTLDCGCGPIGALAIMAEAVGSDGQVVGIDANPATVKRAQSVVQALGHANVQVFATDVHDASSDGLGGPFDLAYTRCFLMHQPDVRRTLSRIATLLRPGGWLIAHEPLPVPPPSATPSLPELAEYWELLHASMQRLGAECAIGELPARCAAAGFEVVETSGFFQVAPPAIGFELHALAFAAAKESALATGVADADQIDAVVRRIRAAARGEYHWVSSPYYLSVTAQVPA